MISNAMYSERSTDVPLLTDWYEREEEIILKDSSASDPDWSAAEDRFVAFEPEEIEVLNLNELKTEMGLQFDRM